MHAMDWVYPHVTVCIFVMDKGWGVICAELLPPKTGGDQTTNDREPSGVMCS